MKDEASLARGAFLFCLSHCGNIATAADYAGLSLSDIRGFLHEDDGFASAVQNAYQEAFDRVRQLAWDRALRGVEEPVFYQGEQIGVRQRPSDLLLKYLLQSWQSDVQRSLTSELISTDGKADHHLSGAVLIKDSVTPDRGLTPQEVNALFETDMRLAEQILTIWFEGWRDLSPSRQAALLSMAFNLGGPRLTGFVK